LIVEYYLKVIENIVRIIKLILEIHYVNEDNRWQCPDFSVKSYLHDSHLPHKLAS
jgi:hypothetical protein